jgi:STIP1 family protein 1
MTAHLAEQLKEKGNLHFKQGEYEDAISLYSQAISKNPSNPLLYTNRANARLKVKQWEEVISDCLHSIELLQENMKAFYFLAQAQLELHHPNEALSSAMRAYELCSNSPAQTSSAFHISAFVLKCKRAKWELRERERLRGRSHLLRELEEALDVSRDKELKDIEGKLITGEMGQVAASEEKEVVQKEHVAKVKELRTVFANADPKNMAKREVPDYLVDDISFEIMHDPVVTKNGQSYERATIVEHLKRNPIDPLSRTPLSVKQLRPNLALKKAADEFWENNSGWAYDW